MKEHPLVLLAVIGFCVMVGTLVCRLESRVPFYQGKSIKAWSGAPAPPAVAMLKHLPEDPEEPVRAAAQEALGKHER